MPERGRTDPVADAADMLRRYFHILESLVAEPVADGDPVTGSSGRAPEPWYTPAGHAMMDAHEGIRRLEAWLKYMKNGSPGRRRGGSAGNTVEAYEAVPKLAAGLDKDEAALVAGWLYARITEAKAVHGIDEARRLRHLPRKPGDRLPPRCPNCRTFQLVADLDARVVFCTRAGCEDRNGMPPVATMTTTADGRPALAWADGLTEMAPDMD